jgi:hydroxysqualene synthase
VRMLKTCDPLSERVHLSTLEMLGLMIGAAASEVARRASGRRTMPNRSAAHDA